ncbi:MAG: PH domain-containing protein, partial [Desulfuromonadales bacterium]|nr:PH domain-containing protein [Desulfuromonadales bacterium]
VFLAICSCWQVLGFSLADEYELPWLVWLPLPFVLLGLYFSVGHLLQARLEWNRVYYAITDRRLLSQRGLWRLHTDEMKLEEVTYFSLHQQGAELGTLRVYQDKEKKLVLHCLEHPRKATDLLEKVIKPVTTPIGTSPEPEAKNEAEELNS